MSSDNELVARVDLKPVRDAFPREAHHFTKWLEEHIEALGQRGVPRSIRVDNGIEFTPAVLDQCP